LLLLLQVMKMIAYSFNGVQAIDSNANFTADAMAAAPGKKFITLCEAGGTMKPTVNFPLVSRNFTVALLNNAACVCVVMLWLRGWWHHEAHRELPTGEYCTAQTSYVSSWNTAVCGAVLHLERQVAQDNATCVLCCLRCRCHHEARRELPTHNHHRSFPGDFRKACLCHLLSAVIFPWLCFAGQAQPLAAGCMEAYH
jgi:hypothetical protein